MQKAIIIGLAIILIVVFANRVSTTKNIDENINSLIGCQDYSYVYDLNVPATMTFYVIEKNEEDKEGFFKVISAEETEGSTVLHCGNEYYLIVHAEGYEDYTEKIPAAPFRPIIPEVHKIVLEKL